MYKYAYTIVKAVNMIVVTWQINPIFHNEGDMILKKISNYPDSFQVIFEKKNYIKECLFFQGLQACGSSDIIFLIVFINTFFMCKTFSLKTNDAKIPGEYNCNSMSENSREDLCIFSTFMI